MKQFFITVLGVFVGIFLFFIILVFGLISLGAAIGAKSQKADTSDIVLTLDLRQALRDHNSGQALFGVLPNSVVDIVRSLDRAKTDNKVKGLVIRANEFGMVPASAEEIRLAIKDFQESGKFVLTHSQGFEGTSIIPYIAVSASDEIWQQDTTGFSIAGIRAETGFYGGIFEKIDAEPQFEQFHEFKNAANVYEQTGFTDAHRTATGSLITSLFNTAQSHIQNDRGLTASELTTFLNNAPHSAEAAQAQGLVDKLGHWDDVKKAARERAGGKVQFKPVKSYGPKTFSTGPRIAFVGGQGPVVNGSSADGSNPFASAVTMGGDTVSEAIYAATRDKSVKAIVFRVSTPGGSPAASDQIHDAIAKAKEAGKPVVISMGEYAASGGYYVAANADKIVAMPTTITGSIGVLGGKVALGESFAKIGYNVEDINLGGEYVSAYSADTPFSETQQRAYRGQLEDIYEDFTTRVAEGRDMPIETVKEIAKGRVWTGEQALERGLVDELGGLMKAINVAKDLAGLDADQEIYLRTYPRPKTPQEQIEALFMGTAQVAADVKTLQTIATLPEVQAVIEARQKADAKAELLSVLPKIE